MLTVKKGGVISFVLLTNSKTTMKAPVRIILLLGVALIVLNQLNAQELRTARGLEIESDPLAYLFGGYSLHIAYAFPKIRTSLGVFGINQPQWLMENDAFHVFFNSVRSVSSPAVNIKTITPSSAICLIKSVSCNTFNIAGPNTSPANKAPTTCGIENFFVTKPKTFVLNRINAISNKYLYDSIPTHLHYLDFTHFPY